MIPYATLTVLLRHPDGSIAPSHTASVSHPGGLGELRERLRWWLAQDGTEGAEIRKVTSGRLIWPRPNRRGAAALTGGACLPGSETAPIDRAAGRMVRR